MHKCQATLCGRWRMVLRDFTIAFSTLSTETQSLTEPGAVVWACPSNRTVSFSKFCSQVSMTTPSFWLGIWTQDLMLEHWAISPGSHKVVDSEGQLAKGSKTIRLLRLPGPCGAEHCAHTISDPIRCLGHRPFSSLWFRRQRQVTKQVLGVFL